MARPPLDRIFGVETEFGTLVSDRRLGTPEGAVELIKDTLFFDLKIGALDLHSRDDVFEPSHSGGFLSNGGRMYVDAVGSHLEYATAECRQLKDLVANDRAGQRQIVRALRALELADEISVYNNSIDHFGGHTFGCHENYLIRADDEFLNREAHRLYPFLVTRQIFAGVGRVGGHVLVADGGRPSSAELVEHAVDYIWVSNIYGVRPDTSVNFQLSQRADHILKTMASRVRFNRALINPKWEHFYSHDGTTRLHLLFGEPNQNEYAYALKVGTTSLVLRVLEAGLVGDEVCLNHPLMALREVSRDTSYRWHVDRLGSAGTIGAVDLHRLYLSAAQEFRGSDPQTDWILDEWEATLDGLERDPLSMGDRLDWVAKLQVVEQFREVEGLEWGDDALHSVDLEYHNIDPDRSLFYALPSRRMVSEVDIADAMVTPPQDTRAKVRGHLVDQIVTSGSRYYIVDWNGVVMGRNEYVDLSNPYVTELE